MRVEGANHDSLSPTTICHAVRAHQPQYLQADEGLQNFLESNQPGLLIIGRAAKSPIADKNVPYRIPTTARYPESRRRYIEVGCGRTKWSQSSQHRKKQPKVGQHNRVLIGEGASNRRSEEMRTSQSRDELTKVNKLAKDGLI